MANSMGVLPLKVTCVFLTVAALRIHWAGVICAREGLVQVFGGCIHQCQKKFLARFGHGVCGPVGILFTLCIR